MDEKEEEIEALLYDNGTLEGFFEKFVPDVVDRETFWARYFYRVYRLKQAEDARAKLVKRVIAGEEEEELSWEVDDSDESEEEVKEEKKEAGENITEKGIVGASESNEEKPIEETEREEIVETSEKPKEEAKGEIVETLDKTIEEVIEKEVVETPKPIEEKKPTETSQVENVEEVENVKSQGDDDLILKTEDKVPSEPKSDPGESSKDSDFSVISSQPSMQEEEDLEWDEIEDLGEHEDKDKKLGGSSRSPKKLDLRKRLSAPEDDEDLSWDIEDDD
ncbi:uncharacterized protein A4U43_C07F9010 [Asparagus officinalis]|uniref:BSD domain-containing protein n=2 Tax=Asparagus officinalis TaxID=4686 RepID=A0A5P1EAI5_ASPOF|nr:uncharacterized protein A4U43_C07F9010 [Asparagus officinalis]